MMNSLEELRINIGMDANTFYPMLITLLSIIVPFAVAIIKGMKSKFENNLFDLHCKRENDFFYGIVLLLEMFCTVLVAALYVMICAVLTFLGVEVGIWGVAIYIVLDLLATIFMQKRMFIRKRLLGKKQCSWLIYIPMFILGIVFYSAYTGVYIAVLNEVLGFGLLVVEMIGLLCFQGRYIQYKYSSAIFHMNNGEIIDCKDISRIERKFNSLIIREENEQTRFKYDDISRVKYYGECTVKLLVK